MEEIKEKQKVLDRLNELKIKGLGCAFCGTSSREFEAYPYILVLDGVKVIQIRCPKCGNIMLFDYNVLMKDKD